MSYCATEFVSGQRLGTSNDGDPDERRETWAGQTQTANAGDYRKCVYAFTTEALEGAWSRLVGIYLALWCALA